MLTDVPKFRPTLPFSVVRAHHAKQELAMSKPMPPWRRVFFPLSSKMMQKHSHRRAKSQK
jgi:hypothetical protein